MSLTESLTALIDGKPIADDDLEQAALFVLDALANAVAGRNSEPGRILIQWWDDQPPSVLTTTFALGGLTHIQETDDLHRASVVHPGCVVVPAAFAVARARDLKGTAFLRAVLRGFEATCRVGMAVGTEHYRIWHNTATCGPYGSAYAAADLLNLDPGQKVHALGNAGTQSSGLWQFLETGAMSKQLHAGHAAQAGLLAAQLASLGFTGPPEILEGRKGFFAAACPDAVPGAITAAPDGDWQLRQTSIKPWPSCRHTHPAVDAAIELSGQIGNRAVSEIRIETYQAAADVCDRPAPASEYAAKFSLQHCVAAALKAGALGFGSFDEASRTDLGKLRDATEIVVTPAFSDPYPDAWGSAVTVSLSDGTGLTARRTHCLGDPDAPLSRDAMLDKAAMLLDHGGHPDPQGFIAAVLDLPNDGPLPDLPQILIG